MNGTPQKTIRPAMGRGMHPHAMLESVIRHARIIVHLKLVLVVIAVLLLVALIIVAANNSGDNRFRLIFSSLESGEAGMPMMTNPRFHGIDADNNPYDVSAESATQKDEDTVILKTINASLSMKDKSWLTVISEGGVMSISKKSVHLTGATQIFHDSGYEFNTTDVTVDMGKSMAYGNSPVRMQGAIGTLRANSFTIESGGKKIILKNAVKVTLYPKRRG